MTTLAKVEKTSGRNFYAVREGARGKEYAYAFEKMSERNDWIADNRDHKAKPATAFEVYQMLNKQADDALIANRQGRVSKVKADAEIYPEKGQRLIRLPRKS